MFQSRRRWRPLLLTAFVAACPLHALAAGPYDFHPQATTLEAAADKDMVTLANDLLSGAPSDTTAIIDRNKYGGAIADAFRPLALHSKKENVRLNAAIIIAGMHTVSTDIALEDLVRTSTDPQVRYWAAKGLNDLLPRLKTFGKTDVQRATDALTDAGKREHDPIVLQEINRALTGAGLAALPPAPATAPEPASSPAPTPAPAAPAAH